MPVTQAFIPVVNGQWVQICEYRESRVALLAQLSDGLGVFSYYTETPLITYNGLLMQAGLTQQAGSGLTIASGNALNPTVLDLNLSRHGDLVKQAWFVWVPGGSGPTTMTFTSSGIFRLPGGYNGVDCWAIGGGGNGSPGSPPGGDDSGYGGGAGATAKFTKTGIVAGHLFTYQVNGAPGNNWVSDTGAVPVVPGDGALAVPGTDGAIGGPSGLGGLAAACISGFVDGGGGGAGFNNPFPLTPYGGGSGGAPGINGNPGTFPFGGAAVGPSLWGGFGGKGGDSDGIIIPQNGDPGILGGGGGGGGMDANTPQPSGLGGLGDAGCIVFDWTAYPAGGGGGGSGGGALAPSPPAGTVVSVFESFEIVAPPQLAKFTVELPKLSPDAIVALKNLVHRIQTESENP